MNREDVEDLLADALHPNADYERVPADQLAELCRAWLKLKNTPPVIQLGGYGTAFDPPGTCRAYTYEHQPGNAIAYRLGEVAGAASRYSCGDGIDVGLNLLKELQAAGFGVFQTATVEAS